jgi:Ca-activated chloride channel family protein
MSFLNPIWLPILIVIPVLALIYALAQRRRSIYAVRFTNLDLLASVVGKRPGLRRHVPTALFLLGLTGLVLAAADPVLNLEVARSRASVMLVIDVSGSMDATDVFPTRLDAARVAARTLINQLPPSAEVGLVSFNTKSTLQAPLSTDRGAVSAALDNLRAGGGTAIGEGITAALDELARSVASTPEASRPPALIVLLTDGSNNAGIDPQAAADNARAVSVPVVTVGIGQRDKATFVHGQQVDGVDEAVLQGIADSTGGKYYYAQASGQLSQIYSSLGSSFGWQFLRIDILVPVLLLGMFALLVGGFFSMRWFRLFP